MECSICLDNSIKLDYITPCNHSFHQICIEEWINSTNNNIKYCPICREVILISENIPEIIIINSQITIPNENCCRINYYVILIFILNLLCGSLMLKRLDKLYYFFIFLIYDTILCVFIRIILYFRLRH